MKAQVVVDIELLKSIMRVKNLSEQESASCIGMSHSMVNRVMNGNRNCGMKFVSGVLVAFPELSYSQLVKEKSKEIKVKKRKTK